MNGKRPGLFISFLCFILTACNTSISTYEQNQQIYTENDIFIRSYECGYRNPFPHDIMIFIETLEQSRYAEENYDWKSDTYFKEMIVRYPIDEYTYVVSYDQVTGTGYYLHVDKVKINNRGIDFIYSSDSYYPKHGPTAQVENGFLHMAAIPKEYLKDCDISDKNVVYPGE